MISIINYGAGNIGSIINMIKKVGGACEVIESPEQLKNAKKLILPGVGSFDHGSRNLDVWRSCLDEAVLDKKVPILGVCLGMQLMASKSEEGVRLGLGWIDADVIKFRDAKVKIPHMGWNSVKVEKENQLMQGNELRFYFVHSYHVRCANAQDVMTTTVHGYEFVSSFSKDNIYGAQFHPEKSHKFGMRLMKNFLELRNAEE